MKQRPYDRHPTIAHICTTFNHRSGGINRLFMRLRAMADHGYRVVLIVGREYTPSPAWEMSGIEVHQVASMVKYINPVKELLAFKNLAGLIIRIRPHVVHTHLAKAGILGRWAAFLCRTPLILHTVHGPTFPSTLVFYRRLPYLWLEWITGRITDYFVFVGQEVRQEYIRKGICRSGNSVVVQTGRPDAQIEALLNQDERALAALRNSFLKNGDRFLVVNVGRMVPSKQQDHAIKVVHELRKAGVNVHLALVGEAFLKEEQGYLECLRELVSRLNLTQHVTLTGHREDALDIMGASDVVLHTSRYEGLPNVLVEGSLVGKPVVTYAVSGAREILTDGVTGFIVPQGDIKAAAEKLLYLAEHPAKSKRMGIRSQADASGEYRESAMIRKKLAFYEKIFQDWKMETRSRRNEKRSSRCHMLKRRN